MAGSKPSPETPEPSHDAPAHATPAGASAADGDYSNAAVAARLGGEAFHVPAAGLIFDGFRALPAAPREGALPVLLVHGWPQFAACWESVAQRILHAGHPIAAYDQRGYSPSARPTEIESYGVDDLVQDLLQVAEALGWPRFHLVGHDWGGVVAWAFAAQHPERLASATVLSTSHPDALAQRLRDDPDQRERMTYQAKIRHNPSRARDTLVGDNGAGLRAVYGGAIPADVEESYVRRFQEPGLMEAALKYYLQLGQGDAVRYHPIITPVLYVWGSADVAFSRGAAELTAGFVDGPYRFVELPGASHWLPEEEPNAVAQHALTWIAAHPA